MTNATFPDWEERRAADYKRQAAEHYTVTIVDRGDTIIYNADGTDIAIPISFHPHATLFLVALAEQMYEHAFQDPYWVALERCVSYLGAESMCIDLVCKNVAECQRVRDNLLRRPYFHANNWTAKYLDQIIFLTHTSLPE